MTPFLRRPPRTLFATRGHSPQVFRGIALLLLTLATPFAVANEDVPGLRAADPTTPTSTVEDLKLPIPGSAKAVVPPGDLQAALAIWRRANARVAEFPRGHMDLLRWESGNPEQTLPAPIIGGPDAQPLGVMDALRHSLRHRPDLYTRPGMNTVARAQVRVAYARHVRTLQRAWIDAVAAQQSARHAAEVLDATRAGSELGRRMVLAGNWSQAKLMRERLTEASAWQAAADAQLTALQAREQLAVLMGWWDATSVAALEQRLPASLPTLPVNVTPGPELEASDIERAVLSSHPSLALERQAVGRRIAGLSTGRWDAWERAADASLQKLPDPANGTATPPHLDDPIVLRDHPLEGTVAAQAALLAMAAERRSMAREAWAQLKLRHVSARHAQDVVSSLQTALAQETLLRYNGMLQNSWELLASARERIQALDTALQARRDYWRAHTDWQALLSGADTIGVEATTSAGTSTPSAAGH